MALYTQLFDGTGRCDSRGTLVQSVGFADLLMYRKFERGLPDRGSVRPDRASGRQDKQI